MEEAVRVFAERGDLVGVVAAIAIGGLAYSLSKLPAAKDGKADKGKRETMDRVLTRVQDIDERLIRVEADFDNMPTREEFHIMDKSLARLDTRVAGIERTTDQTRHAVGRIEDFMLKAAGRDK